MQQSCCIVARCVILEQLTEKEHKMFIGNICYFKLIYLQMCYSKAVCFSRCTFLPTLDSVLSVM